MTQLEALAIGREHRALLCRGRRLFLGLLEVGISEPPGSLTFETMRRITNELVVARRRARFEGDDRMLRTMLEVQA